jgi:hypothetical protein
LRKREQMTIGHHFDHELDTVQLKDALN